MSYQVLARKWRPHSFTDMVGQGHVLKVLINALDSNRLHHAYLFTGTRGVGKTTLARILAKCLNCEAGVGSNPCGECSACVSIDEGRFIDLIEVDAASRAKVDETRELMDNVQYSPTAGRYKVYLIDEVHMFSNHSFNALLKTLEEPPPHVKFLLATTEPKRIPITILSRCMQFNLKHLTTEQIEVQLKTILTEEKIPAEDISIHLIAAAADGSMRDALSLLDQAISYGDGQLDETQVRDMLGTIDSNDLTGLLEDLIGQDAGAMFERINRMAEMSPDYDTVLAELLSVLHDIAIAHMLPAGSSLVDAVAGAFVDRIKKEDVQLYYQIAMNGRRDLYMAPDPKTGFEMTMIRMLAFRPLEQKTGPTPKNSEPANEPMKIQGQVADEQAPPVMGNDSWHNLIDEMALDGLVKELAGHCILKERKENRVHLILQSARDHLLKTTQKEKLQDAIRARFGDEVKLVITVEESPAETPAQRKIRESDEAKQAAMDAIEKDPHVQAIIDTFDATIDKDSTRLHP